MTKVMVTGEESQWLSTLPLQGVSRGTNTLTLFPLLHPPAAALPQPNTTGRESEGA